MQLVPFALNLLLHRKDTPMLLHVALLLHGETTKAHSSIFVVFSQTSKEFWSKLWLRGCSGHYYQILLLEQKTQQLNNICKFLYSIITQKLSTEKTMLLLHVEAEGEPQAQGLSHSLTSTIKFYMVILYHWDCLMFWYVKKHSSSCFLTLHH